MQTSQLVVDPHVVTAGSGPPLVLARGAGGSVAANFTDVIDVLGAQRTLIGVNYPGSGGTPEDRSALQLAVLADTLVDATVKAGFERFPVLGLSLGSAVAITAAIRHPDRVSGLVLTVGFATADPQIRLVVDTWAALASTDRHALARYLVSLSSPTALAGLDDAAIASAVETTLAHYPPGGADQARLAATVDITETLAAVSVPTLVVIAGQDRIVLPESTRALAQRIPHAAQVEYPDAGHIFTPAETTRWIDDITTHLHNHQL